MEPLTKSVQSSSLTSPATEASSLHCWPAMFGHTANDTGPFLPGFHLKGDAIAGRYRIEKLLGAGSSGFVVHARHVYLRRRVTLKILTSMTTAQEKAQRRGLAAAHVAATLRGKHVARIVDTGFTEEGMPFVATERLEGRTVAEELRLRTTVPVQEAVGWILQACEALKEAHAAGVIHGSLKPQNLFLVGDDKAHAAEGKPRTLKVLDFGTAAPFAFDAEDTAKWTWFASPAYLSPEQLLDPHHLDPRVDVWALGVILFQLISGMLPFNASTVSGMLVAVVHDEPALLAAPEVPFDLAQMVHACLAKDAALRPDITTLARALTPFAGSVPDEEPNEPDDDVRSSRFVLASDAQGNEASMTPLEAQGLAELEPAPLRRRPHGPLGVALAAALTTVSAVFATRAFILHRTTSQAELEPPSLEREAMVPLPFVPHSFDVREATPGQALAVPLVAPRWRQLEASPVTAARALAGEIPARKPRPSLAIRENPYRHGVTHPTRLNERGR